jgi:hypothetical protein
MLIKLKLIYLIEFFLFFLFQVMDSHLRGNGSFYIIAFSLNSFISSSLYPISFSNSQVCSESFGGGESMLGSFKLRKVENFKSRFLHVDSLIVSCTICCMEAHQDLIFLLKEFFYSALRPVKSFFFLQLYTSRGGVFRLLFLFAFFKSASSLIVERCISVNFLLPLVCCNVYVTVFVAMPEGAAVKLSLPISMGCFPPISKLAATQPMMDRIKYCDITTVLHLCVHGDNAAMIAMLRSARQQYRIRENRISTDLIFITVNCHNPLKLRDLVMGLNDWVRQFETRDCAVNQTRIYFTNNL